MQNREEIEGKISNGLKKTASSSTSLPGNIKLTFEAYFLLAGNTKVSTENPCSGICKSSMDVIGYRKTIS